ncbi:hypothetical protein ACN28E_51580 [Archangium lansingense]|uniref:hypothetical protein n=1 Tax=Archangium lansingense TaxID=2995310 RepID=UPI003B7FC427
MTLKTFASATALLLSLSPLTIASAQSSSIETFVFETVDSYEILSGVYQLNVTGIIQGEAAPRTIAIPPSTNANTTYDVRVRSCERLALIAMSKPGQYFFEVRRGSSSVYGQPLQGCKLTRR